MLLPPPLDLPRRLLFGASGAGSEGPHSMSRSSRSCSQKTEAVLPSVVVSGLPFISHGCDDTFSCVAPKKCFGEAPIAVGDPGREPVRLLQVETLVPASVEAAQEDADGEWTSRKASSKRPSLELLLLLAGRSACDLPLSSTELRRSACKARGACSPVESQTPREAGPVEGVLVIDKDWENVRLAVNALSCDISVSFGEGSRRANDAGVENLKSTAEEEPDGEASELGRAFRQRAVMRRSLLVGLDCTCGRLGVPHPSAPVP